MRRKPYRIFLAQIEITYLEKILHKGTVNARTITRAQVLLLANEGKTDKEISHILDLAHNTPYDIRKRLLTRGLKNNLYDAPRPGQHRKITGEKEATIVDIPCTK